ncbi:asparagine synthase-related protein [Lederbergia wuyishanensis]|uniref:asparagine synthase (glutamine-hydrolyzing) n=1 Tax=Lederbergia wuyishanensis TaxID=1347903 RepID=A0ABU0D7U6_9BACI|nr:asparagine synthase-related protein [Lederbergia wuyishanensis]MCJ8009105.1 asparagine synthase-related protein [Lederbergia wuyishanensis]MDQ0344443.1 asparagine synthase (glutamine-hydrolyzing) [Lederbergia wuyishanensis]
MSAIAGIYNLSGEPISIEHSSGMMKSLEKYPADDIQTLQRENVFLGCHAQWITPESIGEQLPFYDYARQLAITADAIIDNRKELFEMLQVNRNDQKTIPDSLLILLAYEKWGEDCPKFLIGDFAFMIWDEKNKRLFGARDFSGSRTLYYFKSPQRFVFCTVINPFFTLPYIKKELNEQWLAQFIANPLMFDSIDPETTVYGDICQVPPSHHITVETNKITIKRYSTLPDGKKIKLKSNEEYEEAFREVFQRAVNDRLRTHLQVGSHLSGGLDSSTVASFAAKPLLNQNKTLHTFSYVPVDDFVDWTHKSRIANERPQIESIVKHVGNISPNYLSFDERNPYTEIDEWLEIMETPYKFFENTFWLRGIFEEASKKGVGVLLNGQRGNWSISWGPTIDFYALLLKRLRLIRFYQEMYYFSRNMGSGRKRVLSVVAKNAFPYLYRNQYSTEDDFPIFINKDLAIKTKVLEKLHEEHGIDPRGRINTNSYKIRKQQFKQLYYWNTIGTYGTKLSLNYGVVDRDPSNDLRVVKFCLSVPENQYVNNGMGRSLIRRSTEGYLPDNIRMNQLTKGVQGADGVHRMKGIWEKITNEAMELTKDPFLQEYVNIEVLKDCINKIKDQPKVEFVFDFELKILMRSIILHRFIKNIFT